MSNSRLPTVVHARADEYVALPVVAHCVVAHSVPLKVAHARPL